jgi:membrane fusion protein, multidrug efflux system
MYLKNLVLVKNSLLPLALLLGLNACTNKAAAPAFQEHPVKVNTITVKLSDASYSDDYPATLVPVNQVEIHPQVTGYITGIFFKDGDRVKKGQKLYTVDAQIYNSNYDQAVANLNLQQSNLVKAQKDADRYHELQKDDAIARQQVDYAEAALEAAKKQVEAAQAALQAARTTVGYTVISAPFDGTIGISQVKTGTAVVAGQSLLNVVSTDNPMAVDLAIDQKEIYHFAQLQQQGFKPGDSTFLLAFNQNEIYPYPGQISFLDRSVDPQTGTLKVRLVFPNDKNLLRAGMSGTVKVKHKNAEPVAVIPYKALTEQLGDYFVYLVDNGKAVQRKVKPGNHIGKDLIVKSGLKENDVVIVDGLQMLHDGSQVQASAVN